MTPEQQLNLMRHFYTALQAESMFFYGSNRSLSEITAAKSQQSHKTALQLVKQMNLKTPDTVFTALAELFHCAQWKISYEHDSFTATCSDCKLCAMCKQIGAPSPCKMYCLNPIQALVHAINPNAEFNVASTMWQNSECRINVK